MNIFHGRLQLVGRSHVLVRDFPSINEQNLAMTNAATVLRPLSVAFAFCNYSLKHFELESAL